jgi:hypothetical protein
VAAFTTARMTAFRPGASPPPVRMPMRFKGVRLAVEDIPKVYQGPGSANWTPVSRRQRTFQRDRRSVRPLGMASAAEQGTERRIAAAEAEETRAGILRRYELRSASAAPLTVVGRNVFEREDWLRHAMSVVRATCRNRATPDRSAGCYCWGGLRWITIRIGSGVRAPISSRGPETGNTFDCWSRAMNV